MFSSFEIIYKFSLQLILSFWILVWSICSWYGVELAIGISIWQIPATIFFRAGMLLIGSCRVQFTWTEAAPPFFSALAQALTVAPVVITSSTSKTFCPASCFPLLYWKALVTLLSRSFAVKFVCEMVGRIRLSMQGWFFLPRIRASSLASTADWLYPRSLLRTWWSGTGIRQSNIRSGYSAWMQLWSRVARSGASHRACSYLSCRRDSPTTPS